MNLQEFQNTTLINGFLSRLQEKRADENEIPESVAAGAGLGGAVGAILPFILTRYRHRISPIFLNERFSTALGALVGGVGGGFAGEWLPDAVRRGQAGYSQAQNIFRQKQSNDTFQNAGAGALTGAGIGAAASLPVLLGRLGRRLPRKLLNKMVLGQATLGAVAGGAASGITSKERPTTFTYHYNYHGAKPGGAAKNVSV